MIEFSKDDNDDYIFNLLSLFSCKEPLLLFFSLITSLYILVSVVTLKTALIKILIFYNPRSSQENSFGLRCIFRSGFVNSTTAIGISALLFSEIFL